MKHLDEAERLAFLEGRASKEISDHIDQCADCVAEVQAWRRTIQRLEHLEWPARVPRRASTHSPMLKWALAASMALCVGFGFGRFSGPNAAEIQAAVKADLDRELQQKLAVVMREEDTSKIDAAAIFVLLNQLRVEQSANYISLRKDLETLASNAEARFRFIQLAADTKSATDLIQ